MSYGLSFAELCILVFFLLVWVPAGLVMIIGALKMKRLESWGWAMAAAIVAVLPIFPLFPLTLAVGCWAILVLNHPEVKRAFGRSPQSGRPAGMPERDEAWHPPRRSPDSSMEVRPAGDAASEVRAIAPPRSERPSDVSAAVPRFSRKAVVGAVWGAFFFISLAGLAAVATATVVPVFESTGPDNGHADPGAPVVAVGLAVALLGLVLVIPGITAPFGTTILGVLAISDIRHSRGRLVGLPLALADALLFPLLILNAVLYALATLIVVGFFETVMPDLPPPVRFAAGVASFAGLVATLLFVNFRIIRGAYRAALPQADPSHAGAPYVAQQDPAGASLPERPGDLDSATPPRPSMTTLFSRAWNRLWQH